MRFWMVMGIGMLLWAAATTAPAASGDHNRYRWTDGKGNLHFDDSLPDRALKFGYDVISPSGRVVRHVDREMTPAELKARNQALAAKNRQQQAAEDQAQNDRQMLAAYPEESDLRDAQRARLQMLDQNIRATEISLENQEQSLTQMLTRAADLEREGKHVPATLSEQMETLRSTIEKQKKYIAAKQQEKVDNQKEFAATLAHYRKLKSEQHN